MLEGRRAEAIAAAQAAESGAGELARALHDERSDLQRSAAEVRLATRSPLPSTLSTLRRFTPPARPSHTVSTLTISTTCSEGQTRHPANCMFSPRQCETRALRPHRATRSTTEPAPPALPPPPGTSLTVRADPFPPYFSPGKGGCRARDRRRSARRRRGASDPGPTRPRHRVTLTPPPDPHDPCHSGPWPQPHTTWPHIRPLPPLLARQALAPHGPGSARP